MSQLEQSFEEEPSSFLNSSFGSPQHSGEAAAMDKVVKVNLINKYLGASKRVVSARRTPSGANNRNATSHSAMNRQETPSGEVSPRSQYSSIMNQFSAFEQSYMHTDLAEIEADTTQQLKKRYSDSQAFKNQEYSLNEKLLEFSLEEELKLRSELIKQRRESLTSLEDRKVFSGVPSSRNLSLEDNIKSLRKLREQVLKEVQDVPLIQFQEYDVDLYSEIINACTEQKNTHAFTRKQLLDFYKSRIQEIKREKYMLLSRFSKFMKTSEESDRSEIILQSRIHKLNEEFDLVTERFERLKLGQKHGNNVIDEDFQISIQDFEHYIRTILKRQHLHKKLHFLLKKIKWIILSEREKLFLKSVEGADPKNQSQPPYITTSLQDIDDQLEELKECFDLSKINIEGDQEFLYAVTKRFAAVFHAQQDALDFQNYPLHLVDELERLQKGNYLDDSKSTIQNLADPDKVYLKNLPWNTNEVLKPQVFDSKVRQEVLQESVSDIDTLLRVETDFLKESDLSYAQKRLRDLSESHMKRAYVKQTVNTENNGGEFKIPNMQGGRSALVKLQSVYLLRYIRVREFRRKLLDLFNYFRSIERRLALDAKGWNIREDKLSSFVARAFPSTSDLEPIESDFIMKTNSIDNRDDSYELRQNKDVLVKDSLQNNIMYEISLKDLQAREEELLKIGSHFIIRNYDENHPIEVDRVLVVEDLYESEAWFQDGKRKVIECYMEAYEHCTSVDKQRHLAQVIVNLIHTKPQIDTSAPYFSESYAAEIIGLEFQYSLLRDIINYQMNTEKKFARHTHQMFERNKHSIGVVENITDDPSLEIKLFPGSTRTGFSDFYSSLSDLGFLHEYIEKAVDEYVSSFKIENPIVITSLKRSIVQQCIVEWKLLTEEEKIQKHIHMKLSDDRRMVEEVPLMEDAEEIISIVHEVIAGYNQVDGKQRFDVSEVLSRQEPSTIPSSQQFPCTIGGFPYEKDNQKSQKRAISLQTFANAIEMIHTWISLLSQLYETDILSNIYKNQCARVGVAIENNLFDPINFGDDSKRGVSLVQTQEVLSIRSQFLSNIAIAEFEQSMAEFNFSTAVGIKRVVNVLGLNELRLALQFQYMQRILFQVIANYNQVPLDDLLINGKDDSIFLTSMPANSIQHIYETKIDEGLVRELIIFADDLKNEIRESAVQSYKEEAARITSESGGNSMIKSKLRELKFFLAGRYCKDMLLLLTPYIHKTQLIRHIGELRSKILMLPENNTGFVIGLQNDRIPKTNRLIGQQQSEKLTSNFDNNCVLAQDGTVVNSMYVPHYIQIMRTAFTVEEVRKDLAVSLSNAHYGNFIRIIQCNHLILSMLISAAHTAVSSFTSLTRPSLGLEQIGQFIKKIHKEIDHLQGPELSDNVVKYLTDRANGIFMKQLIALKHLGLKLTLLSNIPAAKKLQGVYSEFISPPIQTSATVDCFLPNIHHLDDASRVYPILSSSRSISVELHPFSTWNYSIFNRFLLEMSESVRNMFNAEEMATDLIIEDLLQRKHVYSTSMPEDANRITNILLSSMLELWLLKDFFFSLLRKHFTSHTFESAEKMEDLFSHVVIREARRIYENAINEHNRELQMELVRVGSSAEDDDLEKEQLRQEIQSKMMQKDELDFRAKQVEIARQEVHKLMIIELVTVVRSQIFEIRDELRGTVEGEGDSNTKIAIFQDLLHNLLHHSTKSRTKNHEVVLTIQEKHLQEALDECGHALQQWKDREIGLVASELNSLVLHYKRLAISNKQKFDFATYKSDLEKKSFSRRVETEVSDQNYDLVFQVDTVTRENRELNERLRNVKQEAKEELRKEYEDLVQKLTKELLIQKSRFSDFRQQFYKNLDEKFSKVKEDTLVKIEDAKRAGGASLMQKEALRVVVEDNELAKLKRVQAEAKAFEEKLHVMNKLKLISVKGKLERQLDEAEQEKEETNKMYWTNKVKIEERENMLRQELLKLQQELSNSQMEIAELKKEVNIQKKNKQKLRIWKVKNKQLLDELESKVKSFEKWNKYDVDKLLLEKEKLMEDVQKYAKMEARLSKQSQIIEKKSQRQVQEMQRKLNIEQKLKAQAFMKLEEVRLEGGSDSLSFDSRPSTSNSSSLWHKRYLDAMSELQLTIKENAILKEQLQSSGIDLPTPTIVSSRIQSQPSTRKHDRPSTLRQGNHTNPIQNGSLSNPTSESVLPSPAGSRTRGIVPAYRTQGTPSTPNRSFRSSTSEGRRSGSASVSMKRQIGYNF